MAKKAKTTSAVRSGPPAKASSGKSTRATGKPSSSSAKAPAGRSHAAVVAPKKNAKSQKPVATKISAQAPIKTADKSSAKSAKKPSVQPTKKAEAPPRKAAAESRSAQPKSPKTSKLTSAAPEKSSEKVKTPVAPPLPEKAFVATATKSASGANAKKSAPVKSAAKAATAAPLKAPKILKKAEKVEIDDELAADLSRLDDGDGADEVAEYAAELEGAVDIDDEDDSPALAQPPEADVAPADEKTTEKKKKKDEIKIDRNGNLEAQWQLLFDRSKALKPVPYKMSDNYEARTALIHKVLGWGYVLNSQNNRLEVLFKEGLKILIANYKAS